MVNSKQENSTTLDRYLPFFENPWKGGRRKQAQAFWKWHSYLRADLPVKSHSNVKAVLKAEAERIRQNQTPEYLDRSVWNGARQACTDAGLPLEDLASQVEASAIFYGQISFENFGDLRGMMEGWVHPQARLLLGLAGYTYRWQHEEWFPFAESLFLTRILIRLEEDLKNSHCFIPKDMLSNTRVSVEDLKRGNLSDEIGHLLWKWAIRTRDGYGQARELIPETPLLKQGEWRRWYLRKTWVTGLTLIRKAEKNKYNIWNMSFDLTGMDHLMILLQTMFGRNRRRL